jgi:hypothetical protein
MTKPPDRKTVFVIGAGASAEVNLPVGSALTTKISKALEVALTLFGQFERGDAIIREALSLAASRGSLQPNSIAVACTHIRDGMKQASSIDQFIHDRNGDKLIEFCGKLAIVREIIAAETRSPLYRDHKFSDSRPDIGGPTLRNTWYHSFQQLLLSGGLPSMERRLASISLIVFNYDRCIEHYLFYALQGYYQISNDDAASLLKKHLRIYHPYGTVGHLPWSDSANSFNAIAFGETPNAAQLLDLAGQIKTFTEGMGDASAIQSTIAEAKTIVFLGFSFNHMNLDLLKAPRLPGSLPQRRVFATAYGLSESHRKSISNELLKRNMVGDINQVELRALECAKLFHEFGHQFESALRFPS